MAMTVETSACSKVLRVLAAGEFVLEEASRSFLEVINSIDKHQSEKVLFDGRAITGDPTIIERFYYGEFAADAVKRRRRSPKFAGDPKFAYVLSQPVLDPLRLGETVAINRGMNVKAFDNLAEAIDWLGLTLNEVEDR